MTNDTTRKHESNFFTGVVMGSVLGAGAIYLTMTKSGRKVAQAILNAAEELGERGEAYYHELTGEPEKATKESASKTKMKSLIEKLKK